MLLDANSTDEVAAELSADVVIVGAGTVGLFLATALTDAGRAGDILLLDAGSAVASVASNADTSSSVGRPHAGVHIGRAAGLGGTSSLWGGQLAEFSSADLDRDDAPWPLSIDELRIHYRQVYERLGLGVPASDAFYRRRLGGEEVDIEVGGAARTRASAGVGEDVQRFFTYWLKQPNFAAFYQKTIRSAASLRVVLNLTANGCDFDGDTAKRISCLSASGRRIGIRARKFVFAAGTLATNRFFLSTRRSSGVPWASNTNIGHYFQDHLGGKIASVAVLDERRFRNYFENGWVGGIKLQPKLTLSSSRRGSLRNEQSRAGIASRADWAAGHSSGVCGYFSFDSSISEDLANLKRTLRGVRAGLSFSSLSSSVGDLMAVSRSMLPIVSRYVRDRRMLALFDKGIAFNVQAEQIPIARSKICLNSDGIAKDGLAAVAVDWQCDGRELQAIRELALQADAYLRKAGLATLSIEPLLLSADASFLNGLTDTYHQCGGMRMSTAPATGVVDGDCRVWGTHNVWVAGAAVFPSSSHANCTLTALAMSARLVPCLR